MENLLSLPFQELNDRNEILVSRHKHGHIIIVFPRQANHVRHYACVYAFLFGSPHISAATGATLHSRLTRWTNRRLAFPLPWPHVDVNAWERIQLRRSPFVQLRFVLAMIRAIYVHSLIICTPGWLHQPFRLFGQYGSEYAPVDLVSFINCPQRQRKIPEINEYPYATPIRYHALRTIHFPSPE